MTETFSEERFTSDRVANYLRDGITSGTFPPGTRLPRLAELSSMFGCTIKTAHKAYKQLSREGIITTRKGAGAYVCDTAAVSDGELLTRIADLLIPCDPSVQDRRLVCAQHETPWPCRITQAAWLARRLDPATEAVKATTPAD